LIRRSRAQRLKGHCMWLRGHCVWHLLLIRCRPPPLAGGGPAAEAGARLAADAAADAAPGELLLQPGRRPQRAHAARGVGARPHHGGGRPPGALQRRRPPAAGPPAEVINGARAEGPASKWRGSHVPAWRSPCRTCVVHSTSLLRHGNLALAAQRKVSALLRPCSKRCPWQAHDYSNFCRRRCWTRGGCPCARAWTRSRRCGGLGPQSASPVAGRQTPRSAALLTHIHQTRTASCRAARPQHDMQCTSGLRPSGACCPQCCRVSLHC
jgi:hypothetical protein